MQSMHSRNVMEWVPQVPPVHH